MARFTVRVELHGPEADYAALHDMMRAAGFQTTIRGQKTHKLFRLPPGTYVCVDGTASAVDVRDVAQKIASKAETRTAKPPGVFVSKGLSTAWVGLDPVLEIDLPKLQQVVDKIRMRKLLKQ